MRKGGIVINSGQPEDNVNYLSHIFLKGVAPV